MILNKLKILGNAAKWDSCGASIKRKERSTIPQQLQNIVYDCTSKGENCRLMKVLQTNACIHDCKYCINSRLNTKKEMLTPKETANTMQLLFDKHIAFGLFLSSGVTKNSEVMAEKMIEVAKILRIKKMFRGYIHLKVLPGMDKSQIYEMSKYANRLSLNIEAPSKSHLNELSSTKDYHNDLIRRIKWIDKVNRKGLLSANFTTQLIIGASGDTDLDVLKCMNKLYEETTLKRTYFSAFTPIIGTKLENVKAENPIREHRLYEADWLLRIYNFSQKEIKLALNENGNFNLMQDVKMSIAINNKNLFPLDPNDANLNELLKVPGIGPKSAKRIIFERDQNGKEFKNFNELKKLGVISQRAQSFLQLNNCKQLRLSSFT